MTHETEPKTIDKSTWGPGPWHNEPDRAEWTTAAGYPALARRTEFGHWCGYVAVPPWHPAYGKHHGDVEVDVHGGLTYADRCHGEICHVPAPGEPDDVYWLGFDCHHTWDLSPGMEAYFESRGLPRMLRPGANGEPYASYRTLEYVRSECEKLAEQLRAMEPGRV